MMRALDRKLLRDLWAMKSQALAIALVVASGVAIFIATLSAVDSLEATRQTYYYDQRLPDIFVSLKRAPESLIGRLARIPGVESVESRVVIDVTLDVLDMAEPASGRLISVPERGQPLHSRLTLRTGRWIEPNQPREALVAENFAQAHGLKPGDRLAAIINGKKRQLTLVGLVLSPEYVYTIVPGGIMPDDKRYGVLWMGRKALEAAYDMDGAFNDATLALAPGAQSAEVIARIDALTRRYGGLGAIDRSQQISNWYLSGELEQLRNMAQVTPVVFLAVAAFLLNVVLSRMIHLEREQIGALKALGFANRTIALHYTKLALLIAGLGIVLGIAIGAYLGLAMTKMYIQFFRFPILQFDMAAKTPLAAALIAGMAAVGGALGAIRQAASLPPAEAMRPPPPMQFRPSLAERLGARWRLRQTTRMILRQLSRRKGRAALSCAGIAIAAGTFISMAFTSDAMDYMIAIQFGLSNREDAAITLFEARDRGALWDVAHLPGVLAAEPFRAVAVRLRHSHFSKRSTIMGLTAGADLHRPINTALRPISLPPDGLVLSSKLAEMLHVRSGDMVEVEVMEGRRPTRRIRVAGISEQYIGNGALMDIAALNRLMFEGAVISGAYLMLDDARRDAFYARLKQIPAASGVTLRAAIISVVEDTLADIIRWFTAINTAFASLVVFGVVYNNARITLSERGRELASLRVLGLTRREISVLLLGELAIITLAALPLGCLFGYGLSVMMVHNFDTELYRIPLIIDRSTYGYAVVVTVAAALASALVVRRRLNRLDLVKVLKTRE